MKINNHFLSSEGTEKIFTDRKSPNQKALITTKEFPKDLIIHYTAGDLEATINTFMNSKSEASAHLVIDRDGTIYQLIPFDKQAYHAGWSIWDENSLFNGRAIGIELINMGWDVAKLKKDDIVDTHHKHKFVPYTQWHKYSDKQLASLYQVTKLLLHTYELQRILGHEDISAGRKQDPGPAFPWDDFRKELFGTTNNVGKIFKTNVEGVNLRKGDGVKFEIIQTLSKGYEVGLIETWNNWSKVYLANSADEVVYKDKTTKKQKNKKIMGWIRSDLLELKVMK